MYDRVLELASIIDALHWDRFVLVGHSMGNVDQTADSLLCAYCGWLISRYEFTGAGVATLYAGACPERVQKLILIDSVGVWNMAGAAVDLMRRSIIGTCAAIMLPHAPQC